jgi:hypothetical protein
MPARRLKVDKSPALQVGCCQVCGKQDVVTEVSYTKHTGLILLAQTQRLKGFMCRECTGKLFSSCEIHCALAGWWGVISLFIYNPIALIGNLIMYLRARNRFTLNNRQIALGSIDNTGGL